MTVLIEAQPEGPLPDVLSEHALLRIVTENARVGLVVVNTDRRYVYANATYSDMLALPPDLVGRRLEDVLVGVYETQVSPRLDVAFRGERVGYELRKPSPTGERYYAVRYEPTVVNGAVALVVVVITDITEQRQTQLDSSRDAAVSESSDDAIVSKDLDGIVTRWNDGATRIFGYTAAEMVGTSITRIIPEDRRGEETQILEKTRRGERQMHLETQRLTRSGELITVLVSTSPIRDTAGKVVGVAKVARDITERRKLEAQYYQAQKMEAVGRLAGGVAHDFNNLLTAILGYCQLILGDLKPEDPTWADILEIHKAGESAARLTRQLLAFSRKQIIEPKLIDLNVLIRDLEVMLARIIGEDVKVVSKLRPGLAAVLADAGQLEQVVVNLAVNARDAMPDGGTLTIETANVELDEHYASAHFEVKPGLYVALTVSDTGSGMSPEVQARLFEPFFTTKPVGKGTGLGLATVHGIVMRGGGSVSVYSELGRGTSFTLYFPRAADGAEAVGSTPPIAHTRAEGETVLVVEDAEGLRTLTRRILEREGYTVLIASNAFEAERLFSQHPSIDVILSDVVMPGGNGPELIRSLQARRPEVQVIYMSGYTEDAITHHGVLDPGIVFLHKPFTAESLVRKLREVLGR